MVALLIAALAVPAALAAGDGTYRGTIDGDGPPVKVKVANGKVTGTIKVEGPCSTDGTYTARR